MKRVQRKSSLAGFLIRLLFSFESFEGGKSREYSPWQRIYLVVVEPKPFKRREFGKYAHWQGGYLVMAEFKSL